MDLKYSGAQINTGSLSLCGWFKFNKAELAAIWGSYSFDSTHPYPIGNLIGNNSYGGVGLIWSTNNLVSGTAFTSLYIFCAIRSTTNGARATSNVAIPFDTWVHLALVFNKDTKALELWLNGELKTTSDMLDFNDAKTDNLKLNYRAVWGGNGPSYNIPFLVNDVRIYDHALSPLEVKQISQGLILHYPLNRNGWGQENLVWNSNWNVHSTTPPESWVNWGSPPTKEIVTIDGKNWLHVISNTGRFQGYSQNWTKRNGVGELTANTKITVSFTAKLATAASIAPIGIHWCNSSGTIITQNWTTTALTTSPKRYSFTYTTPANCVAFNIMVGDDTDTAHEVWITDIKLEFGEVATPWCPNSSDTLATAMGLDNNVQYDTSGYGNNGTRTGAFSWTSDTSKYNVSTKFNANTSKINVSLDCSGFTNTYTFIWWENLPNDAVMPFGFSNGNTLNCYHNKVLSWNIYDGNANAFKNGSGNTIACSTVLNKWTHMAVVGNGTDVKLYINGEYAGTAPTFRPLTGTQIYLSGNNSGTNYTIVNGHLSDFRIYATALSAEDIKSLYNNSAYIDNQGNIYGAVYEEV